MELKATFIVFFLKSQVITLLIENDIHVYIKHVLQNYLYLFS